MKTYWGMKVQLHTFFDLGTRWRWVISFTHQPLYPQRKSPGTHWIVGWVGPGVEEKNSQHPSGFEPRSSYRHPLGKRLLEYRMHYLRHIYSEWRHMRTLHECCNDDNTKHSSFVICVENTLLPTPPNALLKHFTLTKSRQASDPMFCGVKCRTSGWIINRSWWENCADGGYPPLLTSCKVNHTRRDSFISIIKGQLQFIYDPVYHDIRLTNI
jgi:hypothetical protein